MSQWWLPVAGMILLAFAVGIGGGSLLGPLIGGLFGTPEETSPLDQPGNVKRRADLIAGEGPPGGTASTEAETSTADPATPETGGLLQIPAQVTAPPPGEDSRSEERLLLALDSPLTPPATEIAERIRQGREQRQAAHTPDRRTAGAGINPAPATSALAAMETADAANPVHMHVLARGTVIPAVLQSAIDSELPGLVRAQVAENVYDSVSGRYILIPRGARLIGTYGQTGGSGQRRLFVAWTDLRMPGYVSGGTPIDLDRFSTLGADGASGLKGRRSTGFWQALGAAVLFDLAGNATAILTNQQTQPQSDLGALAGAALGNATSRVTSDYIGGLLERGPRFRIKAGSLMNVLVEQDMSLPAIRDGEILNR